MRARPRSRAGTHEAGFTLIELLVAIAIMAIAFVVVLGAISVFWRSTSIHRSTADLDGAVRTYSERLATAPYDAACPVDYSAVPVPTGYAASISPAVWTGATPAAFSPCPAADLGVQQLTVALTHTASGQRDEFVVVKRTQ
jgi:prepilin-type N-terminal cleavage/methylation domain-containing protein